MYRGRFIKISSVAAASAMFGNLTFAASKNSAVMNLPDEVWARSGDVWVKLNFSAGVYSYRDIVVRLQNDDLSQSVFVHSPDMPLQDIQLRWKYHQPANAKYLGDAWERAYGDLGWTSEASQIKSPWYLLVHDAVYTNCFGVKTGCNTFCSWLITAGTIRLNIDTRNAGAGVRLGMRELHCAEIVTMQSKAGESPFHAAQRFCNLMCGQPRLPKLPVYGINDWYYAYGNNSAALIHEQYKQSTLFGY
jgi:alpha-galactosidase